MKTGFFFLFAGASTTSVQWTLVSIVRTGLSTISSTPTAAARWKTTSASSTSSATTARDCGRLDRVRELGSSLRWRMLSIAPVERSSRTWTRWPLASSSSARWLPMNPAPPVIKYRNDFSYRSICPGPVPRIHCRGPPSAKSAIVGFRVRRSALSGATCPHRSEPPPHMGATAIDSLGSRLIWDPRMAAGWGGPQ